MQPVSPLVLDNSERLLYLNFLHSDLFLLYRCSLFQDYVPLKPAAREPAKTYAFQLDPFQQEAILCNENNQVIPQKYISSPVT